MNSQNPSPKGRELPTRYKLADERRGITRRVEVYTEKYNEDGHIIMGEDGYPKIFKIKVYFTIGCYEDGTPGEVFIIIGKEGDETGGWANSWAMSISLLLQHGVHPKHIIGKFKGVDFIPCGHTNCDIVPICKSIPDLVVRYIEQRFFSEKEEDDEGYSAAIDAVFEPREK